MHIILVVLMVKLCVDKAKTLTEGSSQPEVSSRSWTIGDTINEELRTDNELGAIKNRKPFRHDSELEAVKVLSDKKYFILMAMPRSGNTLVCFDYKSKSWK